MEPIRLTRIENDRKITRETDAEALERSGDGQD